MSNNKGLLKLGKSTEYLTVVNEDFDTTFAFNLCDFKSKMNEDNLQECVALPENVYSQALFSI